MRAILDHADTPAPQSATSQFSKDVQGRLATIRLLQLLAVAALLLPLVLFLFAGLLNYRTTEALANERIERSLEILQEQALKVFQSMNLALDSVDNLLADRSDAQIQADGAMLHQRLRQILSALPEVQSIWIFGPNGHCKSSPANTPPPLHRTLAAKIISTSQRMDIRVCISAAFINLRRGGNRISHSTGRGTSRRENFLASSKCLCFLATSLHFIHNWPSLLAYNSRWFERMALFSRVFLLRAKCVWTRTVVFSQPSNIIRRSLLYFHFRARSH